MHLLCKCGCDMWNGQIPNDIEYTVFSDRRMCEILEENTVDTTDLALKNDYNVWLCPKCGRLYVFKESENKVLRVYKPEDQQI
ncbi:MAG: hypothetical protein K2O14_06090 [Oscillospiraceae bacterium]|nr:hypothetical protein [Oscillospiraceae bacterium]